MGCGASVIIPFDPVSQAEKRTLNVFEGMGFTKYSIDQLYTLYYAMDDDNSNSIDPKEFFRANNVEPLPVYNRFFEIFDLDGSGALSFSEFVLSVWNFLTYDEKTIGQMVFLLCPRRDSLRPENGKMMASCKLSSFKSTIKSLHGKLSFENSQWIDTELRRADERWPDSVCFADQCSVFGYENQSLFTPFMQLRDKFRLSIIGRGFWNDMTGYRKDDDILSAYNYPYIVRDKLLEIEVGDLKETQRKEIIDELRGKSGKVGRNKSFIMKHFGRHVAENQKKSSRLSANFSNAGVNTINFDAKLAQSKAKGSEFPGGSRPEGRSKKGGAGGAGGTSPTKKMPGRSKKQRKKAQKADEFSYDR